MIFARFSPKIAENHIFFEKSLVEKIFCFIFALAIG